MLLVSIQCSWKGKNETPNHRFGTFHWAASAPPCHYPPIADNAIALQWRSGCPLNCEPHACDLLKGNTQTKSFMRQMAPNVSIIMVLNTKSKLSVSTQSPNCWGKRWLFQPHQLLGRRGTKEKERSLCLTNIDCRLECRQVFRMGGGKNANDWWCRSSVMFRQEFHTQRCSHTNDSAFVEGWVSLIVAFWG